MCYLFPKTSLHDYEELCGLCCLGIKERRDDNNYVYEEFLKQLGRGPGWFYETNLIWKDHHRLLRNNKSNSFGRLSGLMKNLTHRNQLERYDNITQDKIKEDIVEKVDEICKQEVTKGEKVFYLPQRPVIRESAETTKPRIVYNASSKPIKKSASLNDCLEAGPPLQNSIWDVLIRSRFKSILL